MSTATKLSTTELLAGTDLKTLPGQGAIPDLRKHARSLLEKNGIPDTKNEEYRHTPIKRALEKNIAFAETKEAGITKLDKDQVRIPGLDAWHIVFVNGLHSRELSDSVTGIEVTTLAGTSQQALVDAHLGKYATPEQDAFAAWNTAAWSDGTLIVVPKNTNPQKPLVIVTVVDNAQQQAKAITRNLVVVGENSSVELIERTVATGNEPVLTNHVTEIVAGKYANIKLAILQDYTDSHHHIGNTVVHQEDNSNVWCHTLSLSGGFIRNNLKLIIDGEHCEGHMHGLYLLKDNSFVDNHTVVDHKKPNSHSNEVYRGVLDDAARGVFNGKIFVRPDAQKTNAFQANRNILLSDKATVNTKPQLEIWADDVKCSHGCTTGQLDEDALFYLRARGIPESKALGMLLYAFVSETFSNISNEQLLAFVDKQVNNRLTKDA